MITDPRTPDDGASRTQVRDHGERVLDGDRVTRVAWLPGSDRLRGECSCGASAEAGDPVHLQDWLLAHPDHPATVVEPDQETAEHVPPPHRVLHPWQAAGERRPVT